MNDTNKVTMPLSKVLELIKRSIELGKLDNALAIIADTQEQILKRESSET
jgi:hypothetical protein